MNKESEKKEALMRIPIFVVSFIIFWLWSYLIFALMITNFFITIFKGKRNKEIAEIIEVWNTNFYHSIKYLEFLTNEKPFPFSNLKKNISKFE